MDGTLSRIHRNEGAASPFAQGRGAQAMLRDLLTPSEDSKLEACRVSTATNSARNETEVVLHPIHSVMSEMHL